jgi:hypothetical protein
MTVEPFTGASIVDALKGLFTPGEAISQQYRKGLMGRDSGGMNWREDQNVVNQTFGYWNTTVGTLTYNTTTLPGSLQTGWASSSTITLTSNQQLTLNQGDTFTIANVYPVNPQNRQAYGSNRLRSFVVNATTTFNGAVSINVSPAIITAGQFQNCAVGTTSTTAAVVLFGTPNSQTAGAANAIVSPQNILMHKSAFTLAMADLPLSACWLSPRA